MRGFGILFISLTCFISCRPGVEKEAIFQKLDPAQTQVLFSNNVNDTDSLNILDYLYFYNGGGVAAADFNNDGLEDLYFTSNLESNKLYINKSELKFEDITEKAGVKGDGSWKTGVTVVDINADGFNDIYVCVASGYRDFKGKNLLFINNGDLTFTESAAEWGVDFEGLSTNAAFFDYDKDGDLDLFLLTHSVHNNDTYGDSSARFKYNKQAGDHLFRNDGGTFTDVTVESGIYASPIGYGLGLSVADFYNDGWDDLYIGNDFFEQDYYYLNQKDGTFKEVLKEAFGHTGLFSMGCTVSDINKDGYADVLTTDMLPEDMKALKSTVNDEASDVYNLRVKNGFHYQYSRNCLQLNLARGAKFADIGLYAGISATDWTWSPLIQDFDMDGIKDIFFSNGIKKRLTDLDYLKYLAQPYVAKVGADRRYDKEKIDMMPDGRVPNYLFKGRPDVKFSDVSAFNDMKDLSCSSGAVAVDLDNDGDLEIVTNNMNEPAFIYKNLSRERASENKNFIIYSVKYSGNNKAGIGTKFYLKSRQGVDRQEIQTSNAFQSNQSCSLLFTFVKNDVPQELLLVWPDNSYQRISDFEPGTKKQIRYDSSKVTKSGDISVVIENFINDRKQVDYQETKTQLLARLSYNSVPDFNYYALLPHSYLPLTPAVAVGDVNGDTWDDIYVGGKKGEEKYLLIGQKDGNYKRIEVEAFRKADYGDSEARWIDVDNDKDLDLIIHPANHPFMAAKNIEQPLLFLNKGNFIFEQHPLPRLKSRTSKFYAADFNGDGLTDLFFTGAVSFLDYTNASASYMFFNKGNGKFEVAPRSFYSDLAKVPYIRDIDIADVDNNGKPDLIIAAEWQPIYIFLNKGDRFERYPARALAKMKGWWQTVKVADLDQDGKPDLIAGNWGVNNKYNVSESSPLQAYNSDFDQNGRKDLLLSYIYQGKYYPFRQKSDLDQEIPLLKKDWLSYGKMADKTTSEIFTGIASEPDLSANYFKSIFISDFLNSENVSDLPYWFQQAPLTGIYPGKADSLIFTGNYSGVIPYEGKYDALGIISATYDPVKRKFSAPRFQINPEVQFNEICFFSPIRRGNISARLILTADGKLLLTSGPSK